MTDAVTERTSTSAVEVVERYVRAYNNHDAATMEAIHAEDVKLMDGDEVRVDGRQKLMDLVFANQFANEGRIEVLSRILSGNWIIDQQVMYGTARGDLRIAVAYRVRNGRIDLAVYLDPEA
jgi:hypothetical protein